MEGPYVQVVGALEAYRNSNAPIAFLDRDGVINLGRPGYVNTASQMQLLDEAASSIARLKQAGYAVCVVTNQSAISRGLWGPKRLIELHQALQTQLSEHDPHAVIDLFITCPHRHEDRCSCRKPSPAMLLLGHRLIRAEMDLETSWEPVQVPVSFPSVAWWSEKPPAPHVLDAMVGDRRSDMGAGWGYGARLFRVPRTLGLATVIDRIIQEEDEGDAFQP